MRKPAKRSPKSKPRVRLFKDSTGEWREIGVETADATDVMPDGPMKTLMQENISLVTRNRELESELANLFSERGDIIDKLDSGRRNHAKELDELRALNRLLESDAEDYQTAILSLARGLAQSLNHNQKLARATLLDELRKEQGR